MLTHITYKPHERPECEVELGDGRWVWGQVRMWIQHDDRTWSANVQYQSEPGETRLGTFAADRLRELEAPIELQLPPAHAGPCLIPTEEPADSTDAP